MTAVRGKPLQTQEKKRARSEHVPVIAQDHAQKTTTTTTVSTEAEKKPAPAPADSTTEGSVTVGGKQIAYTAVAGTLTVGASDTQDATIGLDGKVLPEAGIDLPAKRKISPPRRASFTPRTLRRAKCPALGPVTFLYNGGPGSATMYLHMGSFGPKRVVTTDAHHDPGGPYRIVPNQYGLLDVSDLVFIDAPGTGFSRVMGRNAFASSTAWIRTPTRSTASSAASFPSTTAGPRPSTSSAKAMEHHAVQCSPTCSPNRLTSMASSCFRRS